MSRLATNIKASDHTIKCIEDYLNCLGIPPKNFHGNIADLDEMYHDAIAVKHSTDFAYFKYIESGRRTHDVMKQVFDHFFGGPSKIGSFLEFASGHGRATRFLTQSIPTERFWASDIYTDAMAFQNDYFNVNTIQSVDEPDEFKCDRKYDLITAMSLFSHLPDSLFRKWLSKLDSLLEEDGILLLSTREAGSVRSTPNLDDVPDSGLLYEACSESRSLSPDIYGLTAVTDEYVRKMIAESIPPDANVQVFQRGLYLNQTIYIISRRHLANFPPLELKKPPTGGRAPKWTPVPANNEVYISGWAVDLNIGHQIEAVDVFVDGEMYGQADCGEYRNRDFKKHFPGLENEPKSWAVRIPANQLSSTSIVKFRIKSDTGASVEYYAPPVDCL